MVEKDYLGKDQRKTKDDKSKEDKPIKGIYMNPFLTFSVSKTFETNLYSIKLWMKLKSLS